jgi:hypothetical protein
MTTPILAAATFCIAVTLIQVASLAIAIVRLRQTACGPLSKFYPPVSLVRPLCGIDNYAADTLRSTFELDYPDCEILFCVATAQDTVLPLVRSLIAENPGARAKLLTGDERVSPNPKLNNVLKGWRAAHHDWIIIADSNVLIRATTSSTCSRAGARIPGSSPRRRSAAGRKVFGPRSNARSSTPIRRAGSIWLTVSASVSPRAKPCCGGAPISTAPAASRRWPRKSPKTPPPPRSCAMPVSRYG